MIATMIKMIVTCAPFSRIYPIERAANLDTQRSAPPGRRAIEERARAVENN